VRRLGELSTDALRALLERGPIVAILPVGSVEPHGPHLPLATDTLISERVAERAADRLEAGGRTVVLAPAVPYGVTDYAAGFAGAISVAAPALGSFLRAVVEALLAAGMAHVCVVNNHLEPAHDAAVRAAVDGLARVSVACPLSRRWGRTLSAEYKSGACHAGRYETSLVLAAAPALVDEAAARALPPLGVSLSDGIRAGLTSFRQMGLDRAYTGAPAEATADEGADLVERLATMVVTEIEEHLGTRGAGA
jgi:creatinine amidohydrolase